MMMDMPPAGSQAEDGVYSAPPPPQPATRRFLTGLVGRDILVSRSPWLHEKEADALGVRLVYTSFDFTARGWDAAELPRLLDACERIGFAGLNITYPFKQAVIEHLDDLSDGARRIGAVNAVAFAGGKRVGYNTDVTGFADSMRRGLSGASAAHVVQCGAGGAGSATAFALLDSGTQELTIFDKDAERLADLVTKLRQDFGQERVHAGEDIADAMRRADGLVNATPMGTAKLPGMSVPQEVITPRHWVSDIVYFPLETELLAVAAAKGCRTINGRGMVVSQAASAFEIFTGLTVDRDRMTASFEAFSAG